MDNKKDKYYNFIHPVREDVVLLHPFFTIFSRNDGLDNRGRSLLEGRSISHRPSNEDFCQCPFKDSRAFHEKLMNRTALQYFNQNKSDVYGAIDLILQHLGERSAGTWEALSPLQRLNIFGYVGYRITGYWSVLYASRTRKCETVAVPHSIAILSKICHGIMTLTWDIIKSHSIHWKCGLHDMASEYYTYADRNGLLIGGNEVCAAPPKVIINVIEHVFKHDSAEGMATQSVPRPVRGEMIRYCRLVQYAEVVALLYASMKLRLSIQQKAKGGKSFHLRDVGFTPSFSYFHVALDMLEADLPLMQPEFAVLDMEYWEDADLANKMPIDNLKEAYNQLIKKSNGKHATQADWTEFHCRSVTAMNILNALLTGEEEAHNCITDREVEMFFGSFPNYVFE